MKKNLLIAAAMLLSLPLLASAQDAGSEEAAVRRTVEAYLQTNDPKVRKRALSPEAKIFSVDSSAGKLLETPISKPAKMIPGATTVETPQRIVALDVTKDGASVKVETDLSSGTGPAVTPQKHIQYLSLLKLKGEWKIVSILMPPLRFTESASK